MTKDEHRQRHVELHKAFDELYADYIRHQPTEGVYLPSKVTVMQLLEWSMDQTTDPAEVLNEDHADTDQPSPIEAEGVVSNG